MIRLALLPLIVVLSAISFVKQSLAPDNQLDANRRKHFWGWLSPEMEEHWKRLMNPKHPDYGSFNHSAKNVLAEWVTLDPQRAGKAFSLLLFVAFLAGVLV